MGTDVRRMPTEKDNDIETQVKELAAAVSTQAQVSNRAWLGLMTLALVALLPRVETGGQAGNVTLPFGVGPVDAASFSIVLFWMLVVFTIAFSAAHAQQVRAQKLAQKKVDSFGGGGAKLGIHPRELFDMLRMPSVNRVAPLAQSIRGRHQFHDESSNCPPWLRVASAVYYALLKLPSLAVYFILPAWALFKAYIQVQLTTPARWLFTTGAVMAGVTLFQVFLSDVVYSCKVMKHIGQAEAHSSTESKQTA